MAYQMAPTLVTLNDLEGHSLVAGQAIPRPSVQHFCKILNDMVHCTVPQRQLGFFSLLPFQNFLWLLLFTPKICSDCRSILSLVRTPHLFVYLPKPALIHLLFLLVNQHFRCQPYQPAILLFIHFYHLMFTTLCLSTVLRCGLVFPP